MHAPSTYENIEVQATLCLPLCYLYFILLLPLSFLFLLLLPNHYRCNVHRCDGAHSDTQHLVRFLGISPSQRTLPDNKQQ
jgi:hypothetical protein